MTTESVYRISSGVTELRTVEMGAMRSALIWVSAGVEGVSGLLLVTIAGGVAYGSHQGEISLCLLHCHTRY